MSVVVVALFAAVVGASAGAPASEVGGGSPLLTRVEPHIAAGVRALEAEDPDLALERFRRAETNTDEQRAIVEYNAGQALLFQAMQKAEADAAAQPAPTTPPAAQPGQPGPPEQAAPTTPPDVADALAAFERAAALGSNPSFISEARLAAGNAALVGSKLEDAIAQFRKALVADPGNERARRNLQRALELKQQQPPPQGGGGDGDSDDNKDGDKKDGDQKKDQKDGKQQGQKDDKGDEQKQGDKGDDRKPDDARNDKDGDGKKDEPEPKDGDADKKDGEQGKDDGADKDGKQPAPAPTPKKPTSKEEARRLLEGIRSRERPLSPIEMRGTERRPAENGKDW